jgi:plasmid stabilization system protein ParE
LGREFPGSVPGLRMVPVGHHIVYYLDAGNQIQVVRVLHARMEARSQIDPQY